MRENKRISDVGDSGVLRDEGDKCKAKEIDQQEESTGSDKTKKMMHRKCVGTDGWMSEEDEVIILKEINNIGQARKPTQPLPILKRKVSAKQGNLSRQEKLYADILASEMSSIKRKRTREHMEKENEGNKRDKREEIKEERRKTQKKNEEQEWMEKFRMWSPGQKWPITKDWQQGEREVILETRRHLKF